MGKRAKEHRKKVAARNQKIKAEQKKLQKKYTQMFEAQMEELKNKFSAETSNLTVNNSGVEIPFEVVETKTV